MLQLTGLYTAILALIMVILAFNTSAGRIKHRIDLGTGDDPDMEKRLRAFGNFIEYVPMLILLMAVSELQGRASLHLHIFGTLIVLTRVLHALGMRGVMPSLKGRYLATIMTYLLLLIGGGALLFNSVTAIM